MAANPWPQARHDRLVELIAQGLSASQIALELGDGMTRNAVIGRWHRTGIRSGFKPPPRINQPRKPRIRGPRTYSRPRWFPADPVTPQPTPQEISPNPATIFDVSGCRWPISGASHVDYLFCNNADVVAGYSYCGWHCRKAFNYQPRQRSTPIHLPKLAFA